MHKYLGRQINRQSKGYTIVELAVIISVIGILAAITIVSYSGWRKYSIETQLKSDLSGVASAMKNALTFNNAYPAEVPSTFEPSDGVTLTGGGSADGKSYCVSAVSSSDVAIVYHIDSYSTGDSAQVGGCTPITIPITSISSITGTPQVFQTLTAGTITPSDATVSYQWQSSTTSDGTYTDIANETNNTYVVSPSVMGKYIKVVVTGTGSYTGTKTSTTSTAIAIDSNWLTIGTQTWAKKNLNVGTKIAGTTEQTNNSTIEKYCYNNDEANCTTYGALYQWDEAMQYTNTEGAKGICPTGSHIPSDNDWKVLEMQLGMTQAQADLDSAWRGTDQGTKMKVDGSSGLNIPLAGYRITGGSFNYLSSYVLLLSSSESSSNARIRFLETNHTTVARNAYTKAYGFSVRCLGN